MQIKKDNIGDFGRGYSRVWGDKDLFLTLQQLGNEVEDGQIESFRVEVEVGSNQRLTLTQGNTAFYMIDDWLEAVEHAIAGHTIRLDHATLNKPDYKMHMTAGSPSSGMLLQDMDVCYKALGLRNFVPGSKLQNIC